MITRRNLCRCCMAIAGTLLIGMYAAAAELDLTRAVVVVPANTSNMEQQAARMLVEEVARRSWIEWKITDKLPEAADSAIVIGPAVALRNLVGGIPSGAVGREGF